MIIGSDPYVDSSSIALPLEADGYISDARQWQVLAETERKNIRGQIWFHKHGGLRRYFVAKHQYDAD
jgi:hypothetical protein